MTAVGLGLIEAGKAKVKIVWLITPVLSAVDLKNTFTELGVDPGRIVKLKVPWLKPFKTHVKRNIR
jgi:hypothetical protein